MKDLSHFINENNSLDFIATTLQMMPNFESFGFDELIITSIQILRVSSLDDYSRRSFLLLEGSDDSKFWICYISSENCKIIICNGKKHVVAAIEKISKEKITGVLGIVDDDFDSLEGKSLDLPNLIATETHDLECLLLRSQAFDKVLSRYANDREIEKLEKTEGQKIREALLDRGMVFGRLRWLSLRNKWGLYRDRPEKPQKKFEPIKREYIVDKEKWIIDETKLLETVIQELAKLGHSLTAEELSNLIVSLPQDADPWKVCNGHELVYLLETALIGKLATSEPTKGGIRRGDDIPNMLIYCIDSTEFLATELATKVKIWECDNQPYQIFRAYN